MNSKLKLTNSKLETLTGNSKLEIELETRNSNSNSKLDRAKLEFETRTQNSIKINTPCWQNMWSFYINAGLPLKHFALKSNGAKYTNFQFDMWCFDGAQPIDLNEHSLMQKLIWNTCVWVCVGGVGVCMCVSQVKLSGNTLTYLLRQTRSKDRVEIGVKIELA